jgi:hypothetical protein
LEHYDEAGGEYVPFYKTMYGHGRLGTGIGDIFSYIDGFGNPDSDTDGQADYVQTDATRFARPVFFYV